MDYQFVGSGPEGEVYRATCPYCSEGRHIRGLASAFAWGRDHASTVHPEPRP